MDSLLFFCTQMNHFAGKNSNRLFGLDFVSIKKSEIIVNEKKGIQCNNENSSEIWQLGRTVLDKILEVYYFKNNNLLL